MKQATPCVMCGQAANGWLLLDGILGAATVEVDRIQCVLTANNSRLLLILEDQASIEVKDTIENRVLMGLPPSEPYETTH